MFHPDCRLDLSYFTGHLHYDGSIYVTLHAKVRTPDGSHFHVGDDHTHRISPRDPRWRMVMEALTPAVHEHHAALGLTPPEPGDLPLHMHPQGFPGMSPLPEPKSNPLTDAETDTLRAHIVRRTEQELSAKAGKPITIPARDHPLKPTAEHQQ